MKKIILVNLCIILLFCTILTGCKKEPTTGIEKIFIDDNGDLIALYLDGTEENLGKINNKTIASTYINDAGELIINYSDNTQENLGLIVSENVWRERDDTIYVLANVSTHKEPTKTADIQDILSYSKSAKRIATNGAWNKVVVNNKVSYIPAEYTTTNIDDITFDEETKVIYTQARTTLYLYPCATHEQVERKTVEENTELLQLGKNKSGTWVKVKYGDIQYYCIINTVADSKVTNQTTIPVVVN